jgi:hypothetical protein
MHFRRLNNKDWEKRGINQENGKYLKREILVSGRKISIN